MPQSKCGALPLGYEAIKVVERDGFEPSNPKEQIYSLPRLATSLPLQVIINFEALFICILVASVGFEPTNVAVRVRCLTAWLRGNKNGAGNRT